MKPFTTAAFLALASVSAVTAAPAAFEFESTGNVTVVHRTKDEALQLAKLRKRDESDPDMTLDSRQLPSFGAYWEHWNFQGASFYHRANIDGKGYYIGNDWNDRISSIRNFDYDKKCSYWTEWDSGSGGYCWGSGVWLAGVASIAQLGSPYNDAISCRECSWN